VQHCLEYAGHRFPRNVTPAGQAYRKTIYNHSARLRFKPYFGDSSTKADEDAVVQSFEKNVKTFDWGLSVYSDNGSLSVQLLLPYPLRANGVQNFRVPETHTWSTA
jgi:hypothetical protein